MAKATKRAARRRADKFNERHFKPYAIQIGRMALSWNSLHESLGTMFGLLMGDKDGPMQMAVWQAAKFDRPKREILRAAFAHWVAPNTIGTGRQKALKPRIRGDIEWMLNQADGLENRRNNAIHAPLWRVNPDNPFLGYWVFANDILPDTFRGNARAQNLEKIDDILSEFQDCHTATIVIRDFADAIVRALGGKSPWPRKPALPTRSARRRTPGVQYHPGNRSR